MPSLAFSLLGFSIVAVTLFGLTLPLGLYVKDSIPLPPRLEFEASLGGIGMDPRSIQYHTCGRCNNTWTLATDERNISNAVFDQGSTSIPDPRGLSALLPFWGQFIDHDIVLSPGNASSERSYIAMTPFNSVILTLGRNEHRNWTYANTGQTCREQFTKNSPEIDATTVYGDYLQPDELARHLRNPNSCFMKTYYVGHGEAIPFNMDGDMMPVIPNSSGQNQFYAGDVRNTEHSILASLHTLWVREHNRLCRVLQQKRPYWTPDQQFWKVRQIVIAKIQHITYEEWLPAWFGTQVNLLSTVPVQRMDTRMSMEFSISSFRSGHSMIPDPIGPFTLPSLFFNQSMLFNHNGIGEFLEAAWETPAQKLDNKVIDGLRNFLFSAGPMEVGEDLVTRNLFRGRDLGMSNYSDVAQCYAFPTVESDALEFSREAFVGLTSEDLYPGSSLPRGLAVIIAEQFKRLRVFDPNFYTQKLDAIGSFFATEVLTTTLASVIRLNVDSSSFTASSVPDNVFFVTN